MSTPSDTFRNRLSAVPAFTLGGPETGAYGVSVAQAFTPGISGAVSYSLFGLQPAPKGAETTRCGCPTIPGVNAWARENHPLTPSPRHPVTPSSRRGFTLVEMLVVVVILTMLSAMVLMALSGTEESARESKTRATIAKLDNIIRTIYESYRTRRVAMVNPATGLPTDTSNWPPIAAAAARLYCLRDLMRMEMPERLTDLTGPNPDRLTAGGPISFLTCPAGAFPTSVSVLEPALHRAYQQRLTAPGAMAYSESAKCLYLIVALAGGEDARSQFSADEVTTDPRDGMQMFIDGWGRPIFFLRWAPGFNQSDVQWNINVLWNPSLGATGATGTTDTSATTGTLGAAQNDHDPFDPRNADPAAWALVPLIYSMGRGDDRDPGSESPSGLFWNFSSPTPPLTWDNARFMLKPASPFGNLLVGCPIRPASFGYIHNHQTQAP